MKETQSDAELYLSFDFRQRAGCYEQMPNVVAE